VQRRHLLPVQLGDVRMEQGLWLHCCTQFSPKHLLAARVVRSRACTPERLLRSHRRSCGAAVLLLRAAAQLNRLALILVWPAPHWPHLISADSKNRGRRRSRKGRIALASGRVSRCIACCRAFTRSQSSTIRSSGHVTDEPLAWIVQSRDPPAGRRVPNVA
jgi:hypothetical protein